jgi:hypothetical protein
MPAAAAAAAAEEEEEEVSPVDLLCGGERTRGFGVYLFTPLLTWSA